MLNQNTRLICRKELTLFFSSPIAYLFLGGFIAVMLYLFFWVETFFARNIADIRPLFQWMPVILIFLAAALTMRMWSEERRSGTLEFVLTSPVHISHFVLGKFYACLVLLLIALLLTVPIAVTVAVLADLDWGPVLSAYLASLLLGASYLSIGLFVSARSETQIVSLIVTTLICGLFNLLGSSLLTDFFANNTGEFLRLLGSGSRFESIERGVIDIRDLYYYSSITIVFLVLNIYTLKKQSWADHGNKRAHRSLSALFALIIVNLLLVNVWLYPMDQLRIDATRGKVFSLTETSKNYLSRLQEPMLIRGYFSAKTHPLLAPLVPRLKDLLKEYEVAGKGRVRVEILDPIQDPEKEDEANKKYGIKPVPLQITDKYQAALVNSYFNVLVQYGDQFEVLGFRDLIEIKAAGETDIEVQLRNPEYDITRSIKKALFAYQSAGNLFEQIASDITISTYISSDQRLPKILKTLKADVSGLLETMKAKAGDKLKVRSVEPEQGNGQLTSMLLQQYGFKPMSASLLDKNTFYFYVVLEGGGQAVQIPLPKDYKIDAFKRYLQAGLKRFATGFLKTAGIVAPEINPYYAQLSGDRNGFKKLKTALQDDLNIQDVDLKKGTVPGDIDILLLLAPKELSEPELFAVDQFVMQGGTLMMATSPYSVEIKDNKLIASKQVSGLEAWLKHVGVEVSESFIMDPRNASFPVPVTRNVGGYSFQEVRMLDYPYFIDIREGLSSENAIVSELGQLTMPWASPIVVNKDINKDRRVSELLSSSSEAWTSSSLDIMPRVRADGKKPFPAGESQKKELMGVVVEGKFNSFFQNRPVPEIKKKEADTGTKVESTSAPSFQSVINHSPAAARIILFSSNEFLQDQSTSLLTSAQGTSYLNTHQLIANAIDWSLEDRGLLKIRSRGHFNQTLPPMERERQLIWEYGNYALALLVIVVIVLFRRLSMARKKKRYQLLLSVKDQG